MQKSLLLIIVAILPAATAFAGEHGLQKPGSAAPPGKLLPVKRATSANDCAAYGAGFIKVEGTGTCVKIGGAVSVGVGASSGSR